MQDCGDQFGESMGSASDDDVQEKKRFVALISHTSAMPDHLLLPEEIIVQEILIRLPIKSLVRCRCVCKSWNSKFYNPDFLLSHLNPKTDDNDNDDYHILMNSYRERFNNVCIRSYDYFFDDDDENDDWCLSIFSRKQLSETRIIDNYVPALSLSTTYIVNLVGSINGLVCMAFQFQHQQQFVLSNPTIRFSKKIIVPEHVGNDCFSPLLYGFGWDSVTNDYKLIVKPIRNYEVSPAGVYSCKTDCWSITENLRCPYLDATHHYNRPPCVVINGSPYWDHWTVNDRLTVDGILKFDTTSNEFKYLDLPNCAFYNLINLNDCLALITGKYYSSPGGIGIVYSFDEEHNTWMKMYTIIDYTCMKHMKVYCFKSGGEIVFQENKNLHLYDPKSREIKSLRRKPYHQCFHDCGGFLINGFSYTPSLVILQGMKALHMS